MAERVLRRLDEELNCSICLDTYSDPKLLQCFHVYCRKCLVPLVVPDQQGHLGLTCPTCRQVTPIPVRGVEGLQPAFHINRLLEIKEYLQEPENPAEGESLIDTSPVKANHCSDHEGKKLELYCETCGELICLRCVMKSGKHHDHDYEELDEAYKKYKVEITASLKPMKKQVRTMEKVLTLLNGCHGEISDQRAVTRDKIHSTFRRLKEVLEVKETELIGELDKLTQIKLKGLAAQTDQVETTLAQLCSCLLFMKESLRTDSKGDVLMMKTNTVRQVKELTTPFQPDIFEPNTEADIVFSVSAHMTELCENYCQIYSPSIPDPSKCHLTGKGAEVAVVGEKATAILQAINLKDEQYKFLVKSLKCELVSEITGTRINCSIKRKGQSHYEISYQPTIKGRHQLHIKAEGQHIRGSPFSIAVRSTVEKLGTPIHTIGGVRGPSGVVISQRGEVVVNSGDCVSVFSPSGEKLRSVGVQGVCGVAMDGEGNILVSCASHCIQRFTGDGQFVKSVGTRGSGPLQFDLPNDITFSASKKKVYVADSGNHRVQALNSDLTFSSTFGKKGIGNGQFSNPWGISCDSTGKVYVADTWNHRIQVFTAEGSFLMKFGRRGQGRGELNNPVGVAIDTSDVVYVSEWWNHRVSVFTSEGQFVRAFGWKGYVGKLDCHGLAVDNNGVVYVCDYSNNSVQIF